MKIAGYLDGETVMVGAIAADGKVSALGPREAFWAKLPRDGKIKPGAAAGKLSEVKQLPAVPLTARVICIGLNYRLHAAEAKAPIPEVPIVFGRWHNTLSCDGDPVPAVGEKFDWEVELGVVIGRKLFKVDEHQAAAGVFGYFAFNDLSARDFQLVTPQWTLGKNTHASGPMSPIVTKDETGDPASPGLRIMTRVNGEILQDSNTSDMIFTVPKLISYLSQAMALNPGDVIVTGTPSGVGIALGKFLKPGDVVEVELERIGRVTTPIVESPASVA